MGEQFSKGDRVRWRSHGGYAEDEVLEKITSDTGAGSRNVRASPDQPQYLVCSRSTQVIPYPMPAGARLAALALV